MRRPTRMYLGAHFRWERCLGRQEYHDIPAGLQQMAFIDIVWGDNKVVRDASDEVLNIEAVQSGDECFRYVGRLETDEM